MPTISNGNAGAEHTGYRTFVFQFSRCGGTLESGVRKIPDRTDSKAFMLIKEDKMNNNRNCAGCTFTTNSDLSYGAYASNNVHGSNAISHSDYVYCSTAIHGCYVVTECRGLVDSCFCNEATGKNLLFNKQVTARRIHEVILNMPSRWEHIVEYAKTLPEFDEDVWRNIEVFIKIYKKNTEEVA